MQFAVAQFSGVRGGSVPKTASRGKWKQTLVPSIETSEAVIRDAVSVIRPEVRLHSAGLNRSRGTPTIACDIESGRSKPSDS